MDVSESPELCAFWLIHSTILIGPRQIASTWFRGKNNKQAIASIVISLLLGKAKIVREHTGWTDRSTRRRKHKRDTKTSGAEVKKTETKHGSYHVSKP